MKLLESRRSVTQLSGSSSTSTLATPPENSPYINHHSSGPGSSTSTFQSLGSQRKVSEGKVASSSKGDERDRSTPPSSFLGAWGGLVRMRSFKGKRRGTISNPEVSSVEGERGGSGTADRVGGSNSDPVSLQPPAFNLDNLPSRPQVTPLQAAPLPTALEAHDASALINQSHSAPPLTQQHLYPSPIPRSTQKSSPVSPQTPREKHLKLPRPSSVDSSNPWADINSSTHLTRYPSDTTSHDRVRITPPGKKLTKRRPASAVYDVELTSRDSPPRNKGDRRASQGGYDAAVAKSSAQVDHVLPTMECKYPAQSISSVHLPEGAEPPVMPGWSLNRNPSSSTAASSAVGPLTDESAMYENLNITYRVQPHAASGSRGPYPSSVGEEDDGALVNVVSKAELDVTNDTQHIIVPSLESSSQAEGEDIGTDQDTPTEKDAVDFGRPPSPSHSVDTSTVTFTPTISSSSTAGTRPDLRVRTTSLAQAHNLVVIQPTPTQAEPYGRQRRRSVTFSQVLAEVEQEEKEPSIQPRRPPLIRARSSSLGKMSMNTNSVYSVGEVVTATRTVVAEARTLHISQRTTYRAESSTHPLSYSNLGTKYSTHTSNLFDPEIGYDDWGQSNDTRLSASKHTRHRSATSSVRRSRPQSISSRPAPAPPHLSSTSKHTVNHLDPPRTAPTASSSVHEFLDPTSTSNARSRTVPSSPTKSKSAPTVPTRPGMPQRQGSFSRLWRTLSGGRSKKESGVASLPMTPVIDRSVDTEVNLVRMLSKSEKKGKQKNRGGSEASEMSTSELRASSESAGNEAHERIPSRPRFASTSHPSLPRERLPFMNGSSSNSPPPFDAYYPSLVSSTINRHSSMIPLAATPLTEIPLNTVPSSATQLSDGRVTFETRERHRERRISVDQDQRRRYRQTLVEIKDDIVFQSVLNDLARLEALTTPFNLDEEGYFPPVVTDNESTGGRLTNAKAWFVIRELVQGERRYGRLLARGVATVKTAVRDAKNLIPPVPTSNIPFSPSTTPAKPNTKLKRPRASPVPASLKLPSHLPPVSPLDVLLSHLPPLLAVSLTLSSRFEHDPSPLGIADSFLSMEVELTREIGRWASEVGNLVALGMGEVVDRSRGSGARRGRSGDDGIDEADEKLGFADIIVMPIQRASRYKLLFQELIATNPHPLTRGPLLQALKASERLAEECNNRQEFDLSTFTRSSSSTLVSSASYSVGGFGMIQEAGTGTGIGEKRRGRKRPVSAGAGGASGFGLGIGAGPGMVGTSSKSWFGQSMD